VADEFVDSQLFMKKQSKRRAVDKAFELKLVPVPI
jgi:hypothetical protein